MIQQLSKGNRDSGSGKCNITEMKNSHKEFNNRSEQKKEPMNLNAEQFDIQSEEQKTRNIVFYSYYKFTLIFLLHIYYLFISVLPSKIIFLLPNFLWNFFSHRCGYESSEVKFCFLKCIYIIFLLKNILLNIKVYVGMYFMWTLLQWCFISLPPIISIKKRAYACSLDMMHCIFSLI